MPDETITVQGYTPEGTLAPEVVPILARVGVFAVHACLYVTAAGRMVQLYIPDFWVPDVQQGFTVTHIPTGFACLRAIRTVSEATRCATLFARSELDWEFTDPCDLTPLHVRVGLAICAQIDHQRSLADPPAIAVVPACSKRVMQGGPCTNRICWDPGVSMTVWRPYQANRWTQGAQD